MSFTSDSNIRIPISEVNDWNRYSGGSRLDFYATDEELWNAVLHVINRSKTKIYGYVFNDCNDDCPNILEVVDIYNLDYLCCIEHTNYWRYWISDFDIRQWVDITTPNTDFDGFCVLNGLIGIFHKNYIHDKLDSSSILITSTVMHGPTGNVYKHDFMLSMMKKIRYQLMKVLKYSTIVVLATGEQFEDKSVRMTENAYELFDSNTMFRRIPGNRIKK